MDDLANWTKNLVVAGVTAALGVCLLQPGPAVATAAAARTVGIAVPPIVAAPAGKFRGLSAPAYDAFLGIPYAAPPVGALRWQPPQPLPSDPTSLRNARTFAPHCAQPPSAFGKASLSEDCLYLNVFAPHGTTHGSGLPVMVWIHGGAFTVGESDDYDPDRLIPHGVVVVTLNYRLGLLGFFATPALDGGGGPVVNYGLMDQQAALAWVKHNIAAFGGDPRRTTIFGESAGGLSVFSQLASPGARDLFSAAIDESGAYQLTLPTLAASEALGTATATALGCPHQTATCLREVTVTKLLATEGAMTVPTVDGVVLPLSPAAAFATGHFHRVPIVDGSNHDEYRLFVAADFDLSPLGPISAGEYPALVTASLGPAAPAVLAQYPLAHYASPDIAFATVVTDYIFACPALGADASLAHFTPVYAYQFADEKAPEPYLPPVSFPYEAAHASEIQFIWDRFGVPNPPLSPVEQHLAGAMTAYWTQFATAHAPSVGERPIWDAFAPGSGNVQSLKPGETGLSYRFAAEHKCAFWASLEAPAPALHTVEEAVRAFRTR
jgi:para-nitrobenzyl esterase